MLKHLRRTDTVQGNASDGDAITKAKKLINASKRVKLELPVKVKVDEQQHHATRVVKSSPVASIVAATIKKEESNVKKELPAFALERIKPVKHGKNADDENNESTYINKNDKLAGETGLGTFKDPYVLPLRAIANTSGCFFCHTTTCVCSWMSTQLERCYASLPVKRQIEVYHKRDWCAKSILPPFVSRLVRLSQLQPWETFYDFGCGNGSVLFQVALMTGAKCIGIEINEKNALVAKEAWKKIRPKLEAEARRTLHVEIICADFCELLRDKDYFGTSPCVIWASNLLLPKSINHFLAERFRLLPLHSRVFCLEDFYPHSRDVAKIRDPEAFELFEMTDYRWQPGSVEWCTMEGNFYQHTRIAKAKQKEIAEEKFEANAQQLLPFLQ